MPNTSITLAFDEISKYIPDTASVTLHGQEQWKNVTDRLFMEFLMSLQAHGSEQQVFEIVQDYIQTCSDTLDLLKSIEAKSTLSRCNYQLVIDWLERNASDSLENDARLQHFTDKTVAWENTLHQLQSKSEIIPYLSRRPIVTKIDPDAPLRENKPLHDIDMEDEARLIREVFIHIRCGKLQEAQSLCVHTGQEWRAAALEGWRLYHDPNYDLQRGLNADEKLPVEGNPNRDIWKLMAWQMAEDKRMPIYARATFAALSGHLSALTSVCKTWEDFLWAYLRVAVDIRVEKEIRASSIRHYVELPDTYWSNEMDIEEVFSELAAKKDVYLQKESDMLHKVQQFLIMDQVGVLMEEMERWLKVRTELDSQKLRFLAHLILFLRIIGRAEKDHIGYAIIEAYVKELMEMREPELVAHYVSALPQDDQITLYAEFLADITETAEREQALSAAEDAGLDIETITKAVVENIRNQESRDEVTTLQPEITKEDLMKVSALDWVVHYPSQRAEAMWQANAIVRHFLAVSKLDAARMAYNKIPIDSIDLVIKQYHPSPDASINVETLSVMQDVPFRVSSSIREFLCYKAYLHYHHAKPTAPKLPPGEVPFTERVAFEHRSNQYKSELERWKMAMTQQTKTVKAQLYNVLTFPEGGWLVDSVNTDADDDIDLDEEMSRRQKQMADLRQLCIPKVFTKNRLDDVLDKICMSSLALTGLKRDPWGCPVSS
ncbi:Nuclear pore complex protein 107 [Blattella germanica]|nr:Nuclear pore complex protein 107 [Blattella germanica]